VATALTGQPAALYGRVGPAGLGVDMASPAPVWRLADQLPPLGVRECDYRRVAAGRVQQRPQLPRGVGDLLVDLGLRPGSGDGPADLDQPDRPPLLHTGQLSWIQAMQEIQDRLAAWEIRPHRIGEVLARAATAFVDSEAWRATAALELLIDAGADPGRTRVLRAQVPPRRVVGLSAGATCEDSPGRAA
jgi:hypothetical protein